jgi:hypothetical protein
MGLGARFRGFGSRCCRFGSVGGSVPGASGSVEVRASAGSAVREGRSAGGSVVLGRSRSERASGVRTGGGDASATRG